MLWQPFDSGSTVGTSGSEGGLIVSDSEYNSAARITLERDADVAPFAITCGIYGWMLHTRFIELESDAVHEIEKMCLALGEIVDNIPPATDATIDQQMQSTATAIELFVNSFP